MNSIIKTSPLAKLSRVALRILASLALVVLLLYAVLYFIMIQNPQKWAKNSLAELSAKTGLEFSFGPVNVELLPFPTLSVSDVSIKGPNLDLKVAWLSVRPNLLRLCTGKIVPGYFSLLRPHIWNRVQFSLTDPDAVRSYLSGIGKASSENSADWFQSVFDSGCTVIVRDGRIALAGTDDTALDLASLNCVLELSSSHSIEGHVEIAAIRISEATRYLGSLEKFRVQGKIRGDGFWHSASDIQTKGVARWVNLIDDSSFQIDYRSRSDSHWLIWNSEADLRLDGISIPAAFSGKAAAVAGGPVVVREGAWRLDADNGAIEGEIENSRHLADASFRGLFTAKRLSLTQWLGFARNLAPGLQLSLDNILNTRIAFKISAKSLNARKIEATCAGARFTGSGSVADFSAPVVFLDLKTDYANLGLGLEESLIRSPIAPFFGHATLTPMPGQPLAPGETEIGYDIYLGAAKLQYGPVMIDDASMRIYPGKTDKNGLEEVQLSASAGFYGGKFLGECVLGAPEDMPLSINARASNINAALLRKDLAAFPFQKGRLRATANIESRGKELASFMANLHGQLDLGAENARFGSTQLNKATTTINLRSANAGKTSASFNGKWKVGLNNQDYNADINLDGKISFNSTGASFKNLPCKMQATILQPVAVLPAKTTVNLNGSLSAQTATQNFSISGANLSLLGQTLTGSASINMEKESVNGKFSAQKITIDKLLSALGFKPRLPHNWNQARLAGDFSATPAKLEMKNMKGAIDQTQFTGNLSWQKKDDNILFAMEADKIDIERIFGGKSKGASQNLDFTYLRPLNLAGELRIKKISGWRLFGENFFMPLNMRNGKLELGPGTMKSYGSQCALSGTMNFNKGLGLTSRTSINGLDLLALGNALQLKGTLLGKATVNMNLSAQLSSMSQFPGAIQGAWNALITGGSWQGASKNGKAAGKPTVFNRAEGSGKIENGVISSSNLTMKGPDLSLKGGGTLNLDSKKLNCRFDVDMKGVPDFPLTLTGSLSNPKTSIGAGKMVLNAIGGIASGIGDAIGGIATGFLKIFK